MGGMSLDGLSPHNSNKFPANTDSNSDFKTISNDYTPESGHIKGCFLELKAFSRLPAIRD